jgi:hypothetical protein
VGATLPFRGGSETKGHGTKVLSGGTSRPDAAGGPDYGPRRGRG